MDCAETAGWSYEHAQAEALDTRHQRLMVLNVPLPSLFQPLFGNRRQSFVQGTKQGGRGRVVIID